MKRKTALRLLMGSVITFSAAVLSIGALTLSWFLGPNVNTTDDDYLDGNIGLRNYFFAGDGSEEKPFEIVSPVHLYNFSRLQNLGIFPGKKYFQVGHVFDIEGVPTLACINGYNGDDPNYQPYLDMGTFSSDPKTKIRTIGGEGVPFVGEFDGKGLPIKNLMVYGNPDDIGVFGYISHEGLVENLVLDNVEVISLGYSKDSSSGDNDLFSQDIDDIFHSASYLATDTSLSLFKYNSGNGQYEETVLKHLNEAAGTTISGANTSDNLVSETDIFNGYFKATFPDASKNDKFTYSIRSSSPLIKTMGDLNLDGSTPTDLIMDFTALKNSEAFNSTTNSVQADAKIYLIASVEVDGHTFSRVIQSYTLEFISNAHAYADGQMKVGIYCDYIDQHDETDRNTNYHHGINVGLLAGHVDGSLKDCYVYKGKLTFNDTDYHPVAAETDTALVGEIGTNVANVLDPEFGLVINGDIGVMNFSKIYSNIRSNFTGGETIMGGRRSPEGGGDAVDYISYKDKINYDTIDKYIDYLRYYDGKKEEYHFITSVKNRDMSGGIWHSGTVTDTPNSDYFNSVDFLWNRVIEDEPATEESEGVDRGLGVFKITTAYNSAAATGNYGTYMVNNMGQSRIINGTPKTKVYFSTAEYDHTVSGQPAWGGEANQIGPERGSTLPSYADINSYGYPFSRDFNYCFEMDLEQMNLNEGQDYLFNTDSMFLKNYLSTKLIDKYGAPIEPGNPRFGFMFRSSENETLSSLSSYMPVNVPGSKQEYGTFPDGSKRYYPDKSIVFRIENPNGANVSVVGNGGDISVYKFDPTTQSESGEHATQKLYSMRSTNVGATDSHRYFTYDYSKAGNGATSTVTVQNGSGMGDNGALYGHIFRLPQGDYVLGARTGTANVYFLAVQGQTEGTIGTNDVISIDDAINDVDFLLEAPTLANFPGGLNKTLFSFKAAFNTTQGTLVVDVVTVADKKYISVQFNQTSTYLTYLLAYSRHTDHKYKINNDLVDAVNYTYQSS